MRYLTVSELLQLHRYVVEQSGGSAGIRSAGALERKAFTEWLRAHVVERAEA